MVLIQSSNEFKIHLKILLKNSKKKGLLHFLLFPSFFSARRPFLSRWPSSPLLPCAPRRPSSASAQLGQATTAAAPLAQQARRPSLGQATVAAPSFPPQPLTARPHVSAPSSSSNRPRLSSRRAATATAPPLRTWEHLSPRPAATNGSRGPARTPAAPRSIFEPAVLGGHSNRDVGIHRPPPREPSSPSRRRLRSPRCELHRDPLSLPMLFVSHFMSSSAQSASAVNLLVVGHGHHRACRRSRQPKRHGRDPLPPPRLPVHSVVHLVSRRPLTVCSGESTAAGHGGHCANRVHRPRSRPG